MPKCRDSGTSRSCICCRRTCAIRLKRRTVSWRTSVVDGAWNGLSDAAGAVPGERTPSSAPDRRSHASPRMMLASAGVLLRVNKDHSPSTVGSRPRSRNVSEAHWLLRYDGGELSPGLTTRSARSGAATVDAVAEAFLQCHLLLAKELDPVCLRLLRERVRRGRDGSRADAVELPNKSPPTASATTAAGAVATSSLRGEIEGLLDQYRSTPTRTAAPDRIAGSAGPSCRGRSRTSSPEPPSWTN